MSRSLEPQESSLDAPCLGVLGWPSIAIFSHEVTSFCIDYELGVLATGTSAGWLYLWRLQKNGVCESSPSVACVGDWNGKVPVVSVHFCSWPHPALIGTNFDRVLVSFHADGILRFWCVEDGKCLFIFPTLSCLGATASFVKALVNKRYLLLGTQNLLLVFDVWSRLPAIVLLFSTDRNNLSIGSQLTKTASLKTVPFFRIIAQSVDLATNSNNAPENPCIAASPFEFHSQATIVAVSASSSASQMLSSDVLCRSIIIAALSDGGCVAWDVTLSLERWSRRAFFRSIFPSILCRGKSSKGKSIGLDLLAKCKPASSRQRSSSSNRNIIFPEDLIPEGSVLVVPPFSVIAGESGPPSSVPPTVVAEDDMLIYCKETNILIRFQPQRSAIHLNDKQSRLETTNLLDPSAKPHSSSTYSMSSIDQQYHNRDSEKKSSIVTTSSQFEVVCILKPPDYDPYMPYKRKSHAFFPQGDSAHQSAHGLRGSAMKAKRKRLFIPDPIFELQFLEQLDLDSHLGCHSHFSGEVSTFQGRNYTLEGFARMTVTQPIAVHWVGVQLVRGVTVDIWNGLQTAKRIKKSGQKFVVQSAKGAAQVVSQPTADNELCSLLFSFASDGHVFVCRPRQLTPLDEGISYSLHSAPICLLKLPTTFIPRWQTFNAFNSKVPLPLVLVKSACTQEGESPQITFVCISSKAHDQIVWISYQLNFDKKDAPGYRLCLSRTSKLSEVWSKRLEAQCGAHPVPFQPNVSRGDQYITWTVAEANGRYFLVASRVDGRLVSFCLNPFRHLSKQAVNSLTASPKDHANDVSVSKPSSQTATGLESQILPISDDSCKIAFVNPIKRHWHTGEIQKQHSFPTKLQQKHYGSKSFQKEKLRKRLRCFAQTGCVVDSTTASKECSSKDFSGIRRFNFRRGSPHSMKGSLPLSHSSFGTGGAQDKLVESKRLITCLVSLGRDLVLGGSSEGDLFWWNLPKLSLVGTIPGLHSTSVIGLHRIVNISRSSAAIDPSRVLSVDASGQMTLFNTSYAGNVEIFTSHENKQVNDIPTSLYSDFQQRQSDIVDSQMSPHSKRSFDYPVTEPKASKDSTLHVEKESIVQLSGLEVEFADDKKSRKEKTRRNTTCNQLIVPKSEENQFVRVGRKSVNDASPHSNLAYSAPYEGNGWASTVADTTRPSKLSTSCGRLQPTFDLSGWTTNWTPQLAIRKQRSAKVASPYSELLDVLASGVPRMARLSRHPALDPEAIQKVCLDVASNSLAIFTLTKLFLFDLSDNCLRLKLSLQGIASDVMKSNLHPDNNVSKLWSAPFNNSNLVQSLEFKSSMESPDRTLVEGQNVIPHSGISFFCSPFLWSSVSCLRRLSSGIIIGSIKLGQNFAFTHKSAVYKFIVKSTKATCIMNISRSTTYRHATCANVPIILMTINSLNKLITSPHFRHHHHHHSMPRLPKSSSQVPLLREGQSQRQTINTSRRPATLSMYTESPNGLRPSKQADVSGTQLCSECAPVMLGHAPSDLLGMFLPRNLMEPFLNMIPPECALPLAKVLFETYDSRLRLISCIVGASMTISIPMPKTSSKCHTLKVKKVFSASDFAYTFDAPSLLPPHKVYVSSQSSEESCPSHPENAYDTTASEVLSDSTFKGQEIMQANQGLLRSDYFFENRMNFPQISGALLISKSQVNQMVPRLPKWPKLFENSSLMRSRSLEKWSFFCEEGSHYGPTAFTGRDPFSAALGLSPVQRRRRLWCGNKKCVDVSPMRSCLGKRIFESTSPASPKLSMEKVSLRIHCRAWQPGLPSYLCDKNLETRISTGQSETSTPRSSKRSNVVKSIRSDSGILRHASTGNDVNKAVPRRRRLRHSRSEAQRFERSYIKEGKLLVESESSFSSKDELDIPIARRLPLSGADHSIETCQYAYRHQFSSALPQPTSFDRNSNVPKANMHKMHTIFGSEMSIVSPHQLVVSVIALDLLISSFAKLLFTYRKQMKDVPPPPPPPLNDQNSIHSSLCVNSIDSLSKQLVRETSDKGSSNDISQQLNCVWPPWVSPNQFVNTSRSALGVILQSQYRHLLPGCLAIVGSLAIHPKSAILRTEGALWLSVFSSAGSLKESRIVVNELASVLLASQKVPNDIHLGSNKRGVLPIELSVPLKGIYFAQDAGSRIKEKDWLEVTAEKLALIVLTQLAIQRPSCLRGHISTSSSEPPLTLSLASRLLEAINEGLRVNQSRPQSPSFYIVYLLDILADGYGLLFHKALFGTTASLALSLWKEWKSDYSVSSAAADISMEKEKSAAGHLSVLTKPARPHTTKTTAATHPTNNNNNNLQQFVELSHQLLHKIFTLSQNSLYFRSAMGVLTEIGRVDPVRLIRAMSFAAKRLENGSSYCNNALLVLVQLVVRHPLLCLKHVSLIVDAVVKCLDPSNPYLSSLHALDHFAASLFDLLYMTKFEVLNNMPYFTRRSTLTAATATLFQLVRVYPMITFHQGSQRFAVGNNDGFVVIFDLRTATKWKVLEGHSGQVSVVGFTEDGGQLASYCAKDKTFCLWQCSSSGFLGGILGMSGKCQKLLRLPGTNQASILSPLEQLSSMRLLSKTACDWILRREDGKRYAIRV